MTLSLVSAPAVEPVAVSDLKAAARVDHSDSDALLARYLARARASAEAFTHRRLITQTVRLTRSGFCDPMLLPVAPIQSVGQVRYVDGAGVTQTMDAADYQLVRSVEPNLLAPAYGRTWPVPRLDYDSVMVDLVAGYGESGDDVPADILHAIEMMAAHWYEHREAVQEDGRAAEMPMGVRFMLTPHVLWI